MNAINLDDIPSLQYVLSIKINHHPCQSNLEITIATVAEYEKHDIASGTVRGSTAHQIDLNYLLVFHICVRRRYPLIETRIRKDVYGILTTPPMSQSRNFISKIDF
jgi:hypothetical protein